MKYAIEEYLDSGIYGFGEEDVENKKSKVVKCRKPHKCICGCDTEIQIGEHALLETGFMDGKPCSAYTALPCIDKWIDECGGGRKAE